MSEAHNSIQDLSFKSSLMPMHHCILSNVNSNDHAREGRKETFYVQLYGVKDYSVREETRCHQMGYSFRLAVRVLLYASSHRQENTYCYTSHEALAGTRNSSMGPPHEGSIQ